ncbi:phosphatase PAP2 family protein [Tamlana sp. 62-3]|uniref:Phosphatase PAP2 family protein n=1 Tax=Neotamlana sargassicola TaxID=2883125 RepID=A0A9X1I549_9FLAO|nr:phosphatase PAP2 family protein [Tamlana sargassicola]MCB4807493.1 phosphatase PAP2 family protein [Tamlana sargassicola]
MKVKFKTVLPFAIVLAVFFPLIFVSKEATSIFINSFHTPKLDSFFIKTTWLGEGFMLISALLLILVKKTKWIIAFLIGLAIHFIFIQINKLLLFPDVLRPLGYFEAIGKEHLLYRIENLRVYRTTSFPSGHTTGATFGAAFIAFAFKKIRSVSWVMMTLSVFVGLSRIYLIQHFLIDVYFGLLFGFVSAVLAIVLTKRIHKKYAWMNKFLIPKFKHLEVYIEEPDVIEESWNSN